MYCTVLALTACYRPRSVGPGNTQILGHSAARDQRRTGSARVANTKASEESGRDEEGSAISRIHYHSTSESDALASWAGWGCSAVELELERWEVDQQTVTRAAGSLSEVCTQTNDALVR